MHRNVRATESAHGLAIMHHLEIIQKEFVMIPSLAKLHMHRGFCTLVLSLLMVIPVMVPHFLRVVELPPRLLCIATHKASTGTRGCQSAYIT